MIQLQANLWEESVCMLDFVQATASYNTEAIASLDREAVLKLTISSFPKLINETRWYEISSVMINISHFRENNDAVTLKYL